MVGRAGPTGTFESFPMSDFANLGQPNSLTGSISSGRRSYGATRADLNYLDTKFLTHKVEANDTLQGLAVKYGVAVEKIKRINKLWSNESLFLKETIKIPYVAPINKWEDEDSENDDNNDNDFNEADASSGGSQESKATSKDEENSESASSLSTTLEKETDLSNDPNCSDFLCKIDSQINKCKDEWKKKRSQQPSRNQVPCVSYDSNDMNKLSPTKQSNSLLERL